VAQKTFSIAEALNFGWNTLKANLGFFAGLFVIIGVINLGPSLLGSSLDQDTAFLLLAFALSLAGWVLGVIISLGLIKVTLAFVDGKKPDFADLFRAYPLFFRYLLASIVYGLIVFFGFLLFIVPGVIWLVKYRFYLYFLVDQGAGPMEALSKSAKITQGMLLRLFWFGILLIILNFFGVLALGVGLAITVPVSALADAFVYRKLSRPE